MAAEPAPASHPGRWLGGLVGGLVSLGVAAVGLVAGGAPSDGALLDLGGGFFGIGLLGVPIGVLVGRALLPAARGGGLGRGLLVGLGFGLIAPPLGAIEIVVGSLWPTANSTGDVGEATLGMLVLLPIAIVYSFVALVATVPAGLAWALLVRVIPAAILRRLEMPDPVSRLGARHALLVAVIALVAVALWPDLAGLFAGPD